MVLPEVDWLADVEVVVEVAVEVAVEVDAVLLEDEAALVDVD